MEGDTRDSGHCVTELAQRHRQCTSAEQRQISRLSTCSKPRTLLYHKHNFKATHSSGFLLPVVLSIVLLVFSLFTVTLAREPDTQPTNNPFHHKFLTWNTVELKAVETQDQVTLPRLKLPDLSATVGRLFFYQLPQDNVTKYQAREAGCRSLPQWLHLNQTTGAFMGVPWRGDMGKVYISVDVHYESGGSSIEGAVFQLEVREQNSEPVNPHKPMKSGTAHHEKTSQQLQTSNSDDGDPSPSLPRSKCMDGYPPKVALPKHCAPNLSMILANFIFLADFPSLNGFQRSKLFLVVSKHLGVCSEQLFVRDIDWSRDEGWAIWTQLTDSDFRDYLDFPITVLSLSVACESPDDSFEELFGSLDTFVTDEDGGVVLNGKGGSDQSITFLQWFMSKDASVLYRSKPQSSTVSSRKRFRRQVEEIALETALSVVSSTPVPQTGTLSPTESRLTHRTSTASESLAPSPSTQSQTVSPPFVSSQTAPSTRVIPTSEASRTIFTVSPSPSPGPTTDTSATQQTLTTFEIAATTVPMMSLSFSPSLIDRTSIMMTDVPTRSFTIRSSIQVSTSRIPGSSSVSTLPTFTTDIFVFSTTPIIEPTPSFSGSRLLPMSSSELTMSVSFFTPLSTSSAEPTMSSIFTPLSMSSAVPTMSSILTPLPTSSAEPTMSSILTPLPTSSAEPTISFSFFTPLSTSSAEPTMSFSFFTPLSTSSAEPTMSFSFFTPLSTSSAEPTMSSFFPPLSMSSAEPTMSVSLFTPTMSPEVSSFMMPETTTIIVLSTESFFPPTTVLPTPEVTFTSTQFPPSSPLGTSPSSQPTTLLVSSSPLTPRPSSSRSILMPMSSQELSLSASMFTSFPSSQIDFTTTELPSLSETTILFSSQPSITSSLLLRSSSLVLESSVSRVFPTPTPTPPSPSATATPSPTPASICDFIDCGNGTCVDLVTDFECVCYTGWTGDFCNNDIDFCNPFPCFQNNTISCEDGNSTYTCNCVQGHTGQNCTESTDPCDPNPCLNGGTCVPQPLRGFECNCPSDLSGRNCENILDPCLPNPCDTGEVCIDLGRQGILCSILPVSSTPTVSFTFIAETQSSVLLSPTAFTSTTSTPSLTPSSSLDTSSLMATSTTVLTFSSSSSSATPTPTPSSPTPSLSPSPSTSLLSSSPSTVAPSPTPSSSPIQNDPPVLLNPIGTILTNEGRPFQIAIQEDSFHDAEDGFSSNLTLSLLDSNGIPIQNSSWIQLRGNMIIEGLPLPSEVQFSEITDHVFILRAQDSFGASTHDFVTVRILPQATIANFLVVFFEGEFEIFNENLTAKIELAKRLSTASGNLTQDNLYVKEFRSGSIGVVYTNVLVSDLSCADFQDWVRTVYQNGQYAPEFLQSISPFRPIDGSAPTIEGPCATISVNIIPTVEIPPDIDTQSESEVILFLAVIVPAVVVALLLFLLALLCFVLYRRRRKERDYLHEDWQSSAFLNRRPVILAGETELPPRARRPIILPNEAVRTRSAGRRWRIGQSLPPPPPRLEVEDVNVHEETSSDEELVDVPFLGAHARQPLHRHDPPRYRLPPDYFQS